MRGQCCPNMGRNAMFHPCEHCEGCGLQQCPEPPPEGVQERKLPMRSITDDVSGIPADDLRKEAALWRSRGIHHLAAWLNARAADKEAATKEASLALQEAAAKAAYKAALIKAAEAVFEHGLDEVRLAEASAAYKGVLTEEDHDALFGENSACPPWAFAQGVLDGDWEESQSETLGRVERDMVSRPGEIFV